MNKIEILDENGELTKRAQFNIACIALFAITAKSAPTSKERKEAESAMAATVMSSIGMGNTLPLELNSYKDLINERMREMMMTLHEYVTSRQDTFLNLKDDE